MFVGWFMLFIKEILFIVFTKERLCSSYLHVQHYYYYYYYYYYRYSALGPVWAEARAQSGYW